MSKLYPIKFQPIPQYRIWGGNQLNEVLPKVSQVNNLGEIWSISGVEDYLTIVENGPLKGKSLKDLIQEYQAELVGKKVWDKFQEKFPILIKFIDAAEPLSVQVHPNDDLAKKRHNSFGKTEMWYIIEAKENAELIIGFQKDISAEKFQKHLIDQNLEEVLNKVPISKGDLIYLPSGRVHAIGAGVILAEIQQSSDITYRIYDYDRIDKDGKKRELHTDLALEAIDYQSVSEIKTNYPTSENQLKTLLDSPYFKTKIYSGNKEFAVTSNEEMIMYICTEGKLKIQTETGGIELKKYESALIPASVKDFILIPTQATLIEVRVP
jgi:mannose-6-phosphate isomerase